MNYSLRYLSRKIIFIFLIIIALILAFSILANIFVLRFKTLVEKILSSYFNQKIYVGHINYLPPNFILLRDISVARGQIPQARISFFIEKANLAFSLKNALTKRNFMVTRIYLENPKIIFVDKPKMDFSDIKLGAQLLFSSLDYLTKPEPMRFLIRRGILIFPQQENRLVHLIINALEINQKGQISAIGSISLESFLKPESEPVAYCFKGSMAYPDIAIDNLEFKKANFYSKLWGSLGKDALHLNGFSFLGKMSGYSISLEDGSSKIISKAQRFSAPLRRKPVTQIIWLSSFGDLNIFDLDCLIKFAPQEVRIERLNFSLNNIPLSLKGSFAFLAPTLIDLSLSSGKPMPFDAQITGSLSEGGFNGKIDFKHSIKTKNKVSQANIEIDVENSALDILEDGRLKISFGEASLSYKTGSDLYRAFLEKSDVWFNFKEKKVAILFKSRLYDGFIIGVGMLDLKQIPFRSSFDAWIKDVSLNQFLFLSNYFAPFSGKLDSEFYLRSHPALNLSGELTVREGNIENSAFFNWLADFFSTEALRKVNFNKLTADFLVNEDAISLNIGSFESSQLKLGGSFSLYKNGLVSGEILLGLPQELLITSSRFKPLLRLLDKDITFVNFDFQLSGLIEAMNFKWLESDFKNRLKSTLPAFVERGLEEDIEEAVKSISSK